MDGLGKTLDARMAGELLANGVTHVTDFYSKRKKKRFVADLCMEVSDTGRVQYELSFPDEKD